MGRQLGQRLGNAATAVGQDADRAMFNTHSMADEARAETGMHMLLKALCVSSCKAVALNCVTGAHAAMKRLLQGVPCFALPTWQYGRMARAG